MIFQLSSNKFTKRHFLKQVEMRDRMLIWEAQNLFPTRMDSKDDTTAFYREMYRGDWTINHHIIRAMAKENSRE